ncbi:MAG: hypothetical protein NZT92_17320 [Abditibacteriales bacterium]|nr:hypothetical protein [Abditibacteriales bacterium]MDW8367696.1 hypothetical protein [Abditibacteriales bacterium]
MRKRRAHNAENVRDHCHDRSRRKNKPPVGLAPTDEVLQLSLFGQTPRSADKPIEFYKHEIGWMNRLILGDSLLVMNALLIKEGMAGTVQMIYMDPPYGIRYASNFQPRINQRDVRARDEDLIREREQIIAYRDTWKLGIPSYLAYLRDRLLLCRHLLTERNGNAIQTCGGGGYA